METLSLNNILDAWLATGRLVERFIQEMAPASSRSWSAFKVDGWHPNLHIDQETNKITLSANLYGIRSDGKRFSYVFNVMGPWGESETENGEFLNKASKAAATFFNSYLFEECECASSNPFEQSNSECPIHKDGSFSLDRTEAMLQGHKGGLTIQ